MPRPDTTSFRFALPRARRLAEIAAFGVLPAMIWVAGIRSLVSGSMLFDFRIFRHAGAAVLAGASPWSVVGFLYPAPTALVFAPFGALPFAPAAAAFVALVAALTFATLWLLDVRDWRCYGIAAISLPVLTGILVGTISPVIAVCVAAAWRYRDRQYRSALCLAAAVTLKLWVWPLVFWLAATRRGRAAAVTVAVSVVANCAGWLVLGFQTVPQFVRVLGEHDRGRDTYSVFALFRTLGLSTSQSQIAFVIVGLCLLVAVGVAGYTQRNDWLSFRFALAASLALTPVLFTHYFLVVLLVPIAAVAQRLSWLWVTPLLLWLCAWSSGSDGEWPPARIVATLGVVGVVLAVARTRSEDHPRIGRPLPAPRSAAQAAWADV